MDNRLFEAARLGNIELLSQLLQENPHLLSEIFLLSPNENPLHIATNANQLNFVREIMKKKPELAHELNKHGFRPLDIASACGHVEIVKALLVSGAQRLKGREGRTALHYAALKGRVEVINELVSACSECVKDVTIVGETALHLAAKYYQIEALKTLIEWVDAEKHGLEEVLNWSDRDGNTLLHLAISGGQLETVELLLSSRVHTTNKLLQLNAMNSKGLTPMDIVDILTESSNNTSILPKLTKILQDACALRAKDITGVSPAPVPVPAVAPPEPVPVPAVAPPEDHPYKLNWRTYFKYQPDRDPPGETRGALLVVFALIVTVTFQGFINPPSLLDEPHTSVFNRASFLLFNTLGFSAAVSVVEYLTAGFPFQRELRIALFSLGWAYGVVFFSHNALLYTSLPNGTNYRSLYEVLVCVAIFLPLASRKVPDFCRWFSCQLAKLKRKYFGG